MAAAAPLIADPIVRNLGTIGGSLAHADPAGDWGSVMLALDAEVVVRGPSGERTVGIDDFLVDIFTTSLAADEIVTGVRVPKPQGAFGGAYLKLERKVGDFATVGAAVHLELSDGTISRAGIGLTAVGPRNVKAVEAEQALQGAEPTDDLFAEAGRLASEATEPISDVRGSADYKRAVVETFVKRGLARALGGTRSQEKGSRWTSRSPSTDKKSPPTSNLAGSSPAPRAFLARGPAPNRGSRRLRHHELRCLHGPPRRHTGEVVHRLGGPGGSAPGDDTRGTRQQWTAPSGPGGLQGGARPAVWFLHSRNDAGVGGAARAQRRSKRGGHPVGDLRKPLPLRANTTEPSWREPPNIVHCRQAWANTALGC